MATLQLLRAWLVTWLPPTFLATFLIAFEVLTPPLTLLLNIQKKVLVFSSVVGEIYKSLTF